jgi:hypothetical protein
LSRKLFIHIGTEKTGTTSLQNFLTFNSHRLKSFGFWYPSVSSASYFAGTAHFPLAGAISEGIIDFISPAKNSGMSTAAKDFVSDSKNVNLDAVISCEHFSSRVSNEEKLSQFRDTLSQFYSEIYIVCYVRNQIDMALSSYSTGIRCGKKDFFKAGDITVDNDYFNYLKILDLWKKVFGQVIVREYSKEKMIDGDISKDFCSAILNIKDHNFQPVMDKNKSLGVLTLECLRQLNINLPTAEENLSSWRFAQTVRNYIIGKLSNVKDEKLSISYDDKLKIINHFVDHNKRLNDEYLLGQASKEWFEVKDDARVISMEEKTLEASKILKKIMNEDSQIKPIIKAIQNGK